MSETIECFLMLSNLENIKVCFKRNRFKLFMIQMNKKKNLIANCTYRIVFFNIPTVNILLHNYLKQ